MSHGPIDAPNGYIKIVGILEFISFHAYGDASDTFNVRMRS